MSGKIDPREIANPKRTLRRREEEAEADESLMRRAKQASTSESPPGPRFTKPYTKEERDEQNRKLEEILRKRERSAP